MLNSQAYKVLIPSAAKALPFFLGKVKNIAYRDSRRYMTPFVFPYAEAGTLGFARKTFYRVICNLVAVGFIDPVERGGLRGVHGSYSRFKLSRRWEQYGMWGFEKKDWTKVIPRCPEWT